MRNGDIRMSPPSERAELRAFLVSTGSDPSTSAEEATTSALRRAILLGVFAPGDRLRQETLAAELGVSRIPLRDALRRLEAEGLVQIDGRRGARVATLSAHDIAELYELRRMLEVHCMRLAIRNLTDEGAAALLERGARLDPHAGHEVEGVVTPRAFYAELYGWSGRSRMVSLILQLRHELHRYHQLLSAPASDEIHEQIQETIRLRDADRAARLMRTHLRTSRDLLLAALRRGQPAAHASRARRLALIELKTD